MAKFNKRISKLTGQPLQNALVIGQGFGFFTNILEIFDTVFSIGKIKPQVKARNLIYKEEPDDLHLIVDISMIFFDRSMINEINSYAPIFTRWKSIIIIEGNEPISREYSQPLYHHGWKCTSIQGFFHVWEIK